jgi:hypothetical protein
MRPESVCPFTVFSLVLGYKRSIMPEPVKRLAMDVL